ncbi:MAG: hypothetical protein P8Y18_03465 [Candidatus Bathyarchaeota archaeon]
MNTLTMIIQNAPYGDERVWNAFRLAQDQKRSKTTKRVLQSRSDA